MTISVLTAEKEVINKETARKREGNLNFFILDQILLEEEEENQDQEVDTQEKALIPTLEKKIMIEKEAKASKEDLEAEEEIQETHQLEEERSKKLDLNVVVKKKKKQEIKFKYK
jgi:hypothetical protein